MENQIVNRIVETIFAEAEKKYPMLGIVPATKKAEVKKDLHDIIFRELSIAKLI